MLGHISRIRQSSHFLVFTWKVNGFTDLDTPIVYRSSDELISLLGERRNEENKQEIDDLVAIHTQLCSLCDLFLVTYNIFSGNQAHPREIKQIRG